MRKLLATCGTLFTALAFMASVVSADDEARIFEADKDENGFLVHRVESPLQSAATSIRVLLPDDREANRRYPVLYVLPVEANNEHRYGDGLLQCKNANLHNTHGLVCVTPTFADLPWYADHPSDPRIRQEAYFVHQVIPFIEKTYPVSAERKGRLLVGFSKSGWGAFSLLLRSPDVFDKAVAWDAPLMKTRPDQFGMGPIFGTQENFEAYRVSLLAREKASLFQAEPRLSHFGFGNFHEHHQQFEQLLNELEIAHHYQDGPKRAHTWHSGWLAEAVAFLVDKR